MSRSNALATKAASSALLRSRRASHVVRRNGTPSALVLAVVVASSMRVSAVHACAPGTPDRPTLCRNNFKIDVYQGPVLAPIRATGLAGAYAALADSVDGLGQNAAATGVRVPQSMDWFDQDVSLGISLPGAYGSSDFDNRGSGTLSSSGTNIFATAGGLVQAGAFGIGGIADFQRFTLKSPSQDIAPSEVTIIRSHFTAAYSFFHNQLTFGGGMRGVRVLVNTSGRGLVKQVISNNVLTMAGAAPEFGFLVKPDFFPFRVGGTYRFAVQADASADAVIQIDSSNVRRAAGLAIPESVSWPWEVELGVALSAGPKPLNPGWIDQNEHEAEAFAIVDRARLDRARARDAELATYDDPKKREVRENELAVAEKEIRAEEERSLARSRRALREERRSRFLNWPREYILVTADILITGKSENAISLQSFLRQEDISSGARITTQPRLGMEGEPLPNRVQARVGTYLEPTRYNVPLSGSLVSGSRQHFTAGVDVKIVHWNILGFFPYPFKLGVAADVAPRYNNFSFGIGVWH